MQHEQEVALTVSLSLTTPARPRRAGGFTLIELLVVIAIILILIGILIPVVGAVRRRAKAAETNALLVKVANAITSYEQEFRAYPGPLPNNEIYTNGVDPDPLNDLHHPDTTPWAGAGEDHRKVTAAENLVLGLIGGLRPVDDAGTWHVAFDPAMTQSARGAADLNIITNAGAQPKQYSPYLQGVALSTGRYSDDAGSADDTIIPEIVDNFGNPMPLLYLRARRGASGVVSIYGMDTAGDPVVPDPVTPTNALPTQYDLRDVIAYTGAFSGPPAALARDDSMPPAPGAASIGVGKDLSRYFNDSGTALSVDTPFHGLRLVTVQAPGGPSVLVPGDNYYLPYDAHAYIQNATQPTFDIVTDPLRPVYGTARQKDGFLLISAGEDRIYGTADDITNFGSVSQ
jgi:prepilin-type N-terminal cleavage/methylation domain-containing protein